MLTGWAPQETVKQKPACLNCNSDVMAGGLNVDEEVVSAHSSALILHQPERKQESLEGSFDLAWVNLIKQTNPFSYTKYPALHFSKISK